MHYPKYTDVLISNELDVHEFISKGPRGNIVKKKQFRETIDPSIYNLGFGDKMKDGSIDDTSDSNNGDRDKILATVAEAIYKFTSVYPKRSILFSVVMKQGQGSTEWLFPKIMKNLIKIFISLV